MEKNALFKLSYGLYVLGVNDGNKPNGCIVNTAVQLTSNPYRIAVTVNKANYTHDVLISHALLISLNGLVSRVVKRLISLMVLICMI